MTSIVQLIEITRSLGIEGTVTMEFAFSQQKLQHEDHRAKRQADKEADERKRVADKEADERRISVEKKAPKDAVEPKNNEYKLSKTQTRQKSAD